MKHALVAVLLLVGARASAADLPCGPAEKGTITLDGLTDDWAEVEGVDAGGRDANLSFTIKCNVEERQLFLLVDVRDNYFVRTKQARPGEDHVELTLAGHKLVVFPGDARAIPTVARWGAKPAKNVKATSALQQQGWAIELSLPFSAIPGYKMGMPLKYAALVADSDSKAQLKTERTVDTAGLITFGESDAALEGFLKDRHLERREIWFDKGISLGGKSGGRVLIAGHLLAFITDGFVYVELPFKARGDVKEARVVDLAGDGRGAVVIRYVEHGGGGSREAIACWRVVGDSEIRRVFAAETAKVVPQGRIDDKVALVKRGRATDIVIDAGAATGLSAANYHESPADDMIPVMLPWGDDKHARYQFSGDEYKRAQ